jgi:hypothetical protein
MQNTVLNYNHHFSELSHKNEESLAMRLRSPSLVTLKRGLSRDSKAFVNTWARFNFAGSSPSFCSTANITNCSGPSPAGGTPTAAVSMTWLLAWLQTLSISTALAYGHAQTKQTQTDWIQLRFNYYRHMVVHTDKQNQVKHRFNESPFPLYVQPWFGCIFVCIETPSHPIHLILTTSPLNCGYNSRTYMDAWKATGSKEKNKP